MNENFQYLKPATASDLEPGRQLFGPYGPWLIQEQASSESWNVRNDRGSKCMAENVIVQFYQVERQASGEVYNKALQAVAEVEAERAAVWNGMATTNELKRQLDLRLYDARQWLEIERIKELAPDPASALILRLALIFESMAFAILKEYARAAELKGFSKMKKPALASFLASHHKDLFVPVAHSTAKIRINIEALAGM